MVGENVLFYVVETREKYDALATKDQAALYWIEDTQELYKGSTCFGTGREASEKVSGLLSATDYAEFKKLIKDVGLNDAASGQIAYMGVDGKIDWHNICLRRDNYFNYKNDFIPQNGEICLIDTARDGLRVVCGDGVTKFADLMYMDEIIVKGYFYDDKFYRDSTYTNEVSGASHKLYIDLNNGAIFAFNDNQYIAVSGDRIPNASEKIAGVLKLYGQIGQNTDGTMTQKAITDELNEKFEMDVIPEEEMIIFGTDIN